jgi:iron-sulfur cluster repair protein YtfE (RIC family)
LKPHFQEEEKYVFPILGNDNILIQKAVQEHQQLAQLFNETDNLEMALKQIAIDLVNHIRFEERILFNQIQAKATPEEITMIEALQTSESFIDNTTDPFWN